MSSTQTQAPRRSQRIMDRIKRSRQPQTPTTSYNFPDLPRELQMQIWTHAADHLTLTENWLRQKDTLNIIYPYLPDIPLQCKDMQAGKWVACVYTPHEVSIVKMRNTLQGVCRLSALMALQAWRRDIKAVVVTETQDQTRDALLKRIKNAKVDMVDGCIEPVKARMEMRPHRW